VNGQAAFDVDGRAEAQKRTDGYRLALVDQARKTGEQRARVGDPDGYALAFETIRRLLDEGGTVSADDVQEATPIRSNAIGSAFRLLAQTGEIVVVGYTTARSPEAHGRIQRAWGRAP
jgi:hypothetical protein